MQRKRQKAFHFSSLGAVIAVTAFILFWNNFTSIKAGIWEKKKKERKSFALNTFLSGDPGKSIQDPEEQSLPGSVNGSVRLGMGLAVQSEGRSIPKAFTDKSAMDPLGRKGNGSQGRRGCSFWTRSHK